MGQIHQPGQDPKSVKRSVADLWPHLSVTILVLFSCLWMVPAQPLCAQESSGEAQDEPAPQESSAEDAETVLEEITVTARRYEENLQDVPGSVNMMTSEYLEETGIINVREVVDFAPGGMTTSFNKMQDEYSLRGISSQTEGASGDSSVATVIDNVVISKEFMKSQTFFDMQGIEILRGPQGTAFGRNASSGLVHLKTARPEHQFGSGATFELGSHETYGVEAFVTGALGENAAGRLAVNFDNLDGYTEDTRTGDGLGGARNIAVRGSLLFTPSDNLEVFLKAQFSRDDDPNPTPRKGKDCTIAYQGDFPQPSVVGAPQPPWSQFPNFFDSCDPWETTISDPAALGEFFLERDILNLTAEIVWQFGEGLALTSVTGFLDGDSDYLIDAHGGPNVSMSQSTQNDAWQLSQELRIDNHGTGNKLRWLAGFYYLMDDHTRDDQNIFFSDNAVFDPQPASGFRPESRDIKQQNNETTALGLFGELNIDLTDKLNLTLGGRFSDDDKDYSVAHFGWGWGGPIAGLTNGVDADGDGILDEQCAFAPGGPPTFGLRFCGSPQDPVGFETPVPTSGSWDNLSFKGSLSYAIDDDRMVYGLISQGYKTGGFQTEPFNPLDATVPYNEETVINYELGYKGTFGGRFRLNASVFFTDYEDLQLFLFINSPTGDFNQVTANAADAEITGFELEYVWQVTDKFRLSGTYAKIDSALQNALIDTDGDGVGEDFSGTRPDNTPEWTGTAIVEYAQPFENGSSLTLRGDWRGVSNVFDDIGEDPNREHVAYDVVGARLVWRPANGNWSLSFWGRNLFEEVYTTNVGPYQPNIAQLNFAFGAPRTYGITVNTLFF